MPVSQARTPASCFDDMLAEVRAEEPPFQPPEAEQPPEWRTPNRGQDKLHSNSSKKIDGPEEGAKPQSQGTTMGSLHSALQLLATSANTRRSSPQTSSTSEDPQGSGALPIPITDQYPCFQVSDQDKVGFIGFPFQPNEDPAKSFSNGAMVQAGSFAEDEDLPSLTGLSQALPISATGHASQVPPSVTAVHKSPSLGRDKVGDGQGCVSVEGEPAKTGNSNDCSPVTGRVAPAPPVQNRNTSSASTPLISHLAENHPPDSVAPKVKELPPPTINMQPRDMKQRSSPQFPLSTNPDVPTDLVRPPPIPIQANHSIHQGMNPAPTRRERPQISPSQCQGTRGKQISPAHFARYRKKPRETLGTHGLTVDLTQAELPRMLQRKDVHAICSKQRSPKSGKFRSAQTSGNNNVSVPNLPSVNQIRTSKGQPVITPTSIIPNIPFEIPDNTQGIANTTFPEILPNIPCGIQQIDGNELLPWGARTANGKRKLSEVDSSHQTPTKESRTVSSTLLTPGSQVGTVRDASQTSRVRQTQQIVHQSPTISVSTHRTATQGKFQPQQQSFVAVMPNLQGQGSSFGVQGQPGPSIATGPESAATLSSPSKKRSIFMREERGEMLKRFVCGECPSAFAFKENCERHFKVVHQGRTVYFCHHCPASYLQSKTMRCHVDKKHHVMDGENSIFPCYWCEFKTNTEMAWTIHVSAEHPGHKNTFRGSAA